MVITRLTVKNNCNALTTEKRLKRIRQLIYYKWTTNSIKVIFIGFVNKTDNHKSYVGSSIRKFSESMNNHFHGFKRYPDRFLYTCIAENGGWDCFNWEILEEVKCNSVRDMDRQVKACV